MVFFVEALQRMLNTVIRALYLSPNTCFMRCTLLSLLFCLITSAGKANVSSGLKAAMEKGQVKILASTTGKNYNGKAEIKVTVD